MHLIGYTFCVLVALGGTAWMAIRSSLSFAIALNVVLFIHETFGHYLCARMLGARAYVIPFFPLWVTAIPTIGERNAAEYAFILLAGCTVNALTAILLVAAYGPFGGIWGQAPAFVYHVYFLSAFLAAVNLLFPLGICDGGKLLLLSATNSRARVSAIYVALLAVGAPLLFVIESPLVAALLTGLAIASAPANVALAASHAGSLTNMGKATVVACWFGTAALAVVALAAVPHNREMFMSALTDVSQAVRGIIR